MQGAGTDVHASVPNLVVMLLLAKKLASLGTDMIEDLKLGSTSPGYLEGDPNLSSTRGQSSDLQSMISALAMRTNTHIRTTGYWKRSIHPNYNYALKHLRKELHAFSR